MRTAIITLLLLFCSQVIQGQAIEQVLEQAQELQSQRRYTEARELYLQVLPTAPKPEAEKINYEIACGYLREKDYDNAVKYADAAIKSGKSIEAMAINIKAMALNGLGKSDKAAKILLKAIYAYPDHHMLYQTLGTAEMLNENYRAAMDAFLDVIDRNFDYAPAHLNLARTMAEMGYRAESLYCYYYYMLLKPQGTRASKAFDELQELFFRKPEHDIKNPNITNSGVASSRLFIKMMSEDIPSYLEEEKFKSTTDFISYTRYFFRQVGPATIKGVSSGELLWNKYSVFFFLLQSEGFTDVMCHYIRAPHDTASAIWLESHKDKVGQFFEWLEKE